MVVTSICDMCIHTNKTGKLQARANWAKQKGADLITDMMLVFLIQSKTTTKTPSSSSTNSNSNIFIF